MLTRSRRHLRPGRLKVYLRPSVPRHGSDEQAQLEQFWTLGRYRRGALGHGVDHRGGDPGLQRFAVARQRSVCELVHVRAERGVLVVYELRAVREFEREDVVDGGECGDFRSWGCYCELCLLFCLVDFLVFGSEVSGCSGCSR